MYMWTARLRVVTAGHLTSDVRLQSDVTGYYLCFSRRGRLVVKVTAYLYYCLLTFITHADGSRVSTAIIRLRDSVIP